MADPKHLILSILQFFDDQQRSPDLNPDAIESLEVATQCLESAYGISIRDVDAAARYPLPAALPQIFTAGLSQMNVPTASVADRDAAERLKGEGNELMKQDDHQAAIDCYTRAIQLDGRNAVYYCNRAAAYSKAGDHAKAIEDCKTALTLDPKYSKAFGRKGLAHSALGQHREARECYRRALEMDPVNDSYRDNLRQSDQSLRDAEAAGSGGGAGGMGGLNLGGMDLSSLLQNPALMNMATSMMANPQMQSMMANLMTASQGDQGTGPQGMSSILQAGQQIAQQMQQNNPELVEQLRAQMKSTPDTKNPANKPDDEPPKGSS